MLSETAFNILGRLRAETDTYEGAFILLDAMETDAGFRAMLTKAFIFHCAKGSERRRASREQANSQG